MKSISAEPFFGISQLPRNAVAATSLFSFFRERGGGTSRVSLFVSVVFLSLCRCNPHPYPQHGRASEAGKREEEEEDSNGLVSNRFRIVFAHRRVDFIGSAERDRSARARSRQTRKSDEES